MNPYPTMPYNGSGQKNLWGIYDSNKAEPSSADTEDVNPATGHCKAPCLPHLHTNTHEPDRPSACHTVATEHMKTSLIYIEDNWYGL